MKAWQGRPRATTARKDRNLSLLARRNRRATASQPSRNLYVATRKRVNRVTVTKRQNEEGFFARSPGVYVPFTSTNRRARFAWCRQHRNWRMDQWATVLFTDESCLAYRTILVVLSSGESQRPATYHLMSENSKIRAVLVW